MRDHDVRTYFTGPHSLGKIFHFAGAGHRRILELWGGSLLSRDPSNIVHFVSDNNLRREVSDKNRLAFSTFSVKIMNCYTV